jgi:hypothetical protein
MAEVKPVTIADQQHEQGAPRPATEPPQQVHHHHEPAPVLGATAVPPSGLAKDLYDFRLTADPWLYDRVAAYHPHAAETELHLNQFKEDYGRQKSASDAAQPAPEPPPSDPGKPTPLPADPPVGQTAR